MNTYHKIQTVYKRDPKTKFKTLLEGEYSLPEIEYLKDVDWEYTEKIDGTNIRVIWNGAFMRYEGRTDKATTPPFLLAKLEELFPASKLHDVFGSEPVCLYGEGYGARIQKGGGNYISDGVDFVLFDVFAGMWLKGGDVEDVAHKLEIKNAPVVEYGNLDRAVQIARDGFNSAWGDFQAEGLVMRPATELLDRRGNRIITKIKCKDFTKQ